MSNIEKKALKKAQIQLGKTSKKERAAVWQYLLKGELSVGYYDAQELQRKGFQILKPLAYYEDQPN